jgi:hypothetical protein
VETTSQGPVASVQFTGCPARPVTYTATDLAQPGPGLIVRLENALTTMDRTLLDVERTITTLTEERDRAAERLGRPFDRMDQLVEARTQRATIDAKMAAAHQPPEPAPAAPAVEPPAAPTAAAVHSNPAMAWAMEQAQRSTRTPIVPGLASTGPAGGGVGTASRTYGGQRSPGADRHGENER